MKIVNPVNSYILWFQLIHIRRVMKTGVILHLVSNLKIPLDHGALLGPWSANARGLHYFSTFLTTPFVASTSTRSPSFKTLVPTAVPTIHGFPNSRAIIAA